jgi:hypothetical protein
MVHMAHHGNTWPALFAMTMVDVEARGGQAVSQIFASQSDVLEVYTNS